MIKNSAFCLEMVLPDEAKVRKHLRILNQEVEGHGPPAFSSCTVQSEPSRGTRIVVAFDPPNAVA